MGYVFNKLFGWATRLSSDEWLYLLIAVTIVGAFCLRGFGSRKEF